MTQVITVSPTTAAYVSDAYKPSAANKQTRFDPLAEAITEWHDKAVADGDIADRPLLSLVQPPSLALTFLTLPLHKAPQVTAEQANEEYKSNSGEPG